MAQVKKKQSQDLTRRNFLKLSGGALGTLLAGMPKGWIGGAKSGVVSAEQAEAAATQTEHAVDIVTVEEAIDMRPRKRPGLRFATKSILAKIRQRTCFSACLTRRRWDFSARRKSR